MNRRDFLKAVGTLAAGAVGTAFAIPRPVLRPSEALPELVGSYVVPRPMTAALIGESAGMPPFHSWCRTCAHLAHPPRLSLEEINAARQ